MIINESIILNGVGEFVLFQGIMFALGYKWYRRFSYPKDMDCKQLLSMDCLPINFDMENNGLIIQIWDDGDIEYAVEKYKLDSYLTFEEFLDYVEQNDIRYNG